MKSLILDIGANTGDDTNFYLLKGFRVVAVEPHPAEAQAMRERFAHAIAQGDLVVEEVGIGPAAGEGIFYLHRTISGWHRSEIEPGHPGTSGLVATRILYTDAASLLARYDIPHYLKVDIEGSDHLVIEALRPERRPLFISFETHRHTGACLAHLHALGYASFQVVDQYCLAETIAPCPAREGSYAKVEFNYDMSGLFGRELPDLWGDLESALRRARELDAAGNKWYDIHASTLRNDNGRLM